jgi:sugar O-acyltransferase (sialic acid O-acetyltransferase NeuD family)
MKETIYILGASGQGKVAANIAALIGYKNIFFIDGDETKKSCGGYPVISSNDDDAKSDGDVFVAIGNARIRKRLCEKFSDRLVTLIHPKAVIADSVQIGKGTVVMAGAVINPFAKIGKGCIINTASSVDHDDIIGDYCHISVGAHLAGTVCIGDMTWIGIGAVVSNNITICSNCMVGAGTVVIKDIKKSGMYIGIPAHLLCKN